MAQKTQVIIVDDLNGDTLPEGQGQTVSFSLDGTSYEIDLNKDNADQLRDDFKRYVEAARKVSGGRGRQATNGNSRRTADSRKDTAAVREWAKANSHEVNERGRIPQTILDAYEAAN